MNQDQPPNPKSLKSFEIQPLPESIDFTNGKKALTYVEGKGQKVYWRNSWVNVYDKGECTPRDWYGKCDGFVILPADTVIWIGAEGGIILEKWVRARDTVCTVSATSHLAFSTLEHNLSYLYVPANFDRFTSQNSMRQSDLL
ncbi:hypothetical protein M431DRAFT_532833 [Trichoderma harzianum CBS 226.95]|uniref:Uncharacterized protein n=1 Tax=Trichoderma harzianum CBS 226.95 TaxID=983964 RepID=A0A2T4A5C5_TRIHA|nr:hypothetical protein M431DRAFT_532833 [Trichoderma harzianum CBS 226.95]PTB52269.1 hypothetical protein M431DRAFT_532833 [Trichoderma harzianum CBS 226.95]